MKNDLDKELQERVFETQGITDYNDPDAHLYRQMGEALKEDDGHGLSLDFAARVADLAMAKPLWKRVLNSILWFFGLIITAGVGIYAVLYAVDFVVPAISMDFTFILDNVVYLIAIVALVLAIELADVVLVRKKPTRDLLSMFD